MLVSMRSRKMPALLITACRSPKVSTAVLISRCAPSQEATLSPLATASPPIAVISSTTCWAGLRSPPVPSTLPPRSLTTTFAPCAARLSACSRPIPRPAPVTIATRPSHNLLMNKPLGRFVDEANHKVVPMCDCQSTTGLTRREAIAGSLVAGSLVAAAAGVVGTARAAAAPLGPAVPAVEVLPGRSIYPRDAWGAALPPKGPIEVGTPLFLLVHHTASSNSYGSAAP